MHTKREWRLIDVLKESADYLARKNIENPRLNAERLIGKALDLSRVELYLQFDQPLSETERSTCRELITRRSEHEPLQYILEETEFMSLPFSVGAGVLIPRPETELLVELAIKQLQNTAHPVILDIGTGSGCIAVSLAHYLPGADITAVDVSEEALLTARNNAVLNNVEESITFLQGDVHSSAFPSTVSAGFDAVISNPPYVTLAEWSDLAEEIADWEPRTALCDEGNGLSFYPVIAAGAATCLKQGGIVMVEIGDTQGSGVKQIFEESGFSGVRVKQDLTSRDRIVTAYKS